MEKSESANPQTGTSKEEDFFLLKTGEKMGKIMVVLSNEEKKLVLSSLMNDTLGNWGDGRSEKLNSLINKIKESKEMPKITGFTK